MRILLVLVLVSGSAYVSLDPPPDMVLTDVFGSSEADLHCYRRPALLLTSGGTLLAFAERERQENGTCWQFGAAVSVVVRRSQDGGATWSTPEVVIAGSSDDTVGKMSEKALLPLTLHTMHIIQSCQSNLLLLLFLLLSLNRFYTICSMYIKLHFSLQLLSNFYLIHIKLNSPYYTGTISTL